MMTHTAVLDFDGATISNTQMNDGGWVTSPETMETSFSSLFTDAKPFLDVNGDGHVDAADASQAIDRIVAKVRQDFAPYDLNIVLGNLSDFPKLLTDEQDRGDVMVVISGGDNNIDTHLADAKSPRTDIGNKFDELAFVFGDPAVRVFHNPDDAINSVAHAISHEMGHCFGLGHVTETPAGMADARSHAMMSSVRDINDPAFGDYGHDYSFQDISYKTDALQTGDLSERHPELNTESQNAHRYLSNPLILGPSKGAWMAVLKPGELTIQGNGLDNSATVAPFFTTVQGVTTEHWRVNLSTTNYVMTRHGPTPVTFTTSATLEPENPTASSLNPFDAPLSKILFRGEAGNDKLDVSNSLLTVSVTAYGGAGRDALKGGGGRDFLFGEGDDDTLEGRGGDDVLQGGAGVDTLRGGAGKDSLYGCTKVADDGVVDHLFGEQDGDTFFQKRSTKFEPIVDDSFEDYSAAVDAIVRFLAGPSPNV